MKTCIQCGADVDFVADTFTFYQVDGEQYIFCANCKNPREPYVSPSEVTALKEQLNLRSKALEGAEKMCVVLLITGLVVGYFVGGW